jgi:hypothetical protein
LRKHQRIAIDKIVARCEDTAKKRGLVWHTQGSGKTFTPVDRGAADTRGEGALPQRDRDPRPNYYGELAFNVGQWVVDRRPPIFIPRQFFGGFAHLIFGWPGGEQAL